MRVFFQEHGFEIWNSIVSGYTTPKKHMKTTTKKELKRNHKMEMDFILDGLSHSVKFRVGQCASTKDICDKYIISTIRNLFIYSQSESMSIKIKNMLI
jgi:hypothetical protein